VRLLRSAVWALRRGWLSFGGKSAWGLGRARATSTDWHALRRSEPADLAAYVGGRPGLQARVAGWPYGERPPRAASGEPPPWSLLALRLRLRFDGPMLVAAPVPRPGERADAEWLAADGEDPREPLLPGSALRGPLRAHSERIAATLGAAFGDLPKTLWGWASDDEDDGRRGLVQVGEGRMPRGANGQPEFREVRLDHVAIDRVTGFAATRKLFSTRALASPTFENEVLVRWHAGRPAHERALALLFVTLRELAGGWIGIGSRTTRGYGQVAEVTCAEARVSLVANGQRLPDERRPDERKRQASLAEVVGLAGLGPALDDWDQHLPVEEARP
jgi:hypothetical protein